MTGQTPFIAENFMAMLTKHLMEDPVPPSVRRPDPGHHTRDGRPGR